MKKFMTILSAAVILAGSLFMTSCNNNGDDDVIGANSWYTYEYSKDDSNTLSVYFMYSTSNYKPSTMRGDLTGVEDDHSIPAGLTFIVYNSSDNEIAGIANNQFIIKSTKSGSKDEDAGFSVVNDATWTAFYAALIINKPAIIKTETSDLPPMLLNSTKGAFKQLSMESLKGLTWKQILGEILLNS